MEIGNSLCKLNHLRDAQTTCMELFLDALAALQTAPYRLHRCRRSARLRMRESYRRLRPGRVS